MNTLAALAVGCVLLAPPAGATPQAMRADARGRLFVGCRDAVFVYEPNGKDGYQPPRRLVAIGSIRDIELRGNDLYILTSTELYLRPDALRQREVQPKRLLSGVPPSKAQRGFRALAWGPEGD